MDQLSEPASTPIPLRIRPIRLFGKKVNGCAIRIPDSGLIMGGENGALSLDAALHVLPQHAEVRAEAGAFRLLPGCGVVALNGERLEQQASRLLQPGDCIEIGFAALRVETDDPSSLSRGEDGCDASGIKKTPPKLVPGFLPGFLPEEVQTPRVSDTETAQQENADPPAQDTVSSEAEALLALLLDSNPAGSADTDGADVTAARLEALTSMPEVTDTGLLPSGLPQRKAAEPDNILTALAAESARVLAGGRMETATPFAAEAPIPAPFPEPSPFPLSDSPSPASSLEEILEGPISIDDVLENLRRRTPDTQTAQAESDLLAAIAEPPRAPDPLRLLAGLAEQLPLREPELPPVLGREHRSPGIFTPYSGGITGTALPDLPASAEQSTEQERHENTNSEETP